MVLVPFYRGAVVFKVDEQRELERQKLFSSPFIEERLYLRMGRKRREGCLNGSRPLLSRSGCISTTETFTFTKVNVFSSPFIEERLYFGQNQSEIIL